MAFIGPNPLLPIKGRIGELYIAKLSDRYVLKRRPRRKPRPPTLAQIRARQKLLEANEYWEKVKTDPELLAVYLIAGRLRQKRATDLAKADYLKAPAVKGIDLSGYIGQPSGIIRAQAEDDFEVHNFRLRLLELDGTLIEEGEAVLDSVTGDWVYHSQASVPAGQAIIVELRAADRPGHQAVKRFDHVCGSRSENSS